MKILHITPYYVPSYAFGGVVSAVEGMARALAACGHNVTVLTTDALTPSSRIPTNYAPDGVWIDGVRVVRMRNRSVWLRGRANLSTPMLDNTVRDWLRWADVIHTHEARTVENLRLLPHSPRGTPILLSPHGTLNATTGRPFLKQAWDRLFGAPIACRFHAVIGLTPFEADEIRGYYAAFGIPAPLIPILPNGVDRALIDAPVDDDQTAMFRATWGLSDGLVVLFMGRLHPRKGVGVLANAFIAANIPDSRLLFVGGDEGARGEIESFNDSRIVLTGYLDGAARMAAWRSADIFVLPAIGEGMSMAALEAMALGIPAILSPGCNLPEAGAAGAAVIVPPEIDGLKAALLSLTNAAERVKMGMAGRAFIRDGYTWDVIAARLETVYTDLIRG